MLIIQATLQRPSPRLHQRATQLREIAPGIIGFRGIPQVVGRCRFAGQPPIVPIIHLRGAVLDTVRNPWATAGISSRRRNAVQAMSDKSFPAVPRETPTRHHPRPGSGLPQVSLRRGRTAGPYALSERSCVPSGRSRRRFRAPSPPLWPDGPPRIGQPSARGIRMTKWESNLLPSIGFASSLQASGHMEEPFGFS